MPVKGLTAKIIYPIWRGKNKIQGIRNSLLKPYGRIVVNIILGEFDYRNLKSLRR